MNENKQIGRRERFTITMDTELVKLIDGIVDGRVIRNRSHAIEIYLERGLKAEEMKTSI